MRLNRLFARSPSIPTLDDAAHEIGVSPRTLRRQLQRQGESYRKIVTAFRAESALAQLKSGTASATAVGQEAGFEDVNAFRRAFKRGTSKTIGEYRARTLDIKRS